VAAGILSAGGVSMFAYVRGQRKKHEFEMQIARSEQKALLAQMNPHFLFNALNSVLHFIIENEKKRAVSYLTKFSSLIRRILEGSRQNQVNLEEELSAINLYLELEKLRFGGRFDYTLTIDPRINPAEVQIPSILIQPFLENALWHGLASKTEGGQLNIAFTLSDNAVICTVEDNGIGRQRSMEINARRHGHTSTGLANVKERIHLLNQLYKRTIDMEIQDLMDSEGKPAGTRVVLIFPL
jgi:sensor histidine kinase YesM